MSGKWIPGNDIRLLENGEEFFPRVFACIAGAQREVILETFILFEDKVGLELHRALVGAAKRGVQVDVTIDGFGSPDLSDTFISELADAGVRMHVFDPGARVFGARLNLLRRMHRKIVVIDAETAFVGGINYSADHLADFGPEGKQDYSVEIRGPLVAEIHRFTHQALAEGQRHAPRRQWWRNRKQLRTTSDELPRVGSAEAIFVTRDNRDHLNDIERHYRIAIRAARKRVIIANAYFFPGYRLIKEMRKAARRGVQVDLILQGEPDMQIVKTAASLLYHHLIKGGVRIFEYTDRPLHGKVAIADDEWATVGSSNLDPLSLSLNLESNVVIRDREFNRVLSERLDKLIRQSCTQIDRDQVGKPGAWQLARSYLAFHMIRRYHRWAAWLPRHMPQLHPAAADPLPAGASRPAMKEAR
ncbi:MAG: cardiolipin synthase ClsB [Ramlibacter sp.]